MNEPENKDEGTVIDETPQPLNGLRDDSVDPKVRAAKKQKQKLESSRRAANRKRNKASRAARKKARK
jgi:hypothetical protein